MSIPMKLNKEVRVHNQIMEVLNKTTLKAITWEVMFFLFAKITKSHKDDTAYTLDLKQFQKMTGKSANLAEYKIAVRELRKITFDIQAEGYDLIDGVICNAKFLHGLGSMQVRITPEMKPFLLELTQDYTAPQLFSMLRMKSMHAKKLYMWCYGHRPTKGLTRSMVEGMTIREFKVETGYINEHGVEQYKQFNDFKKRVLDVAKAEINALSNIKVAYYPKKWGREFYYIDWHIENKNNSEMIALEEFAEPIVELPELSYEQRMTEIGLLSILMDELKLSEWQAKQICRQTRPEYLYLNDVIDAVRNGFKIAIEKGKPVPEDKKGGYTARAILGKYGIDLSKKPDYPKADAGLNQDDNNL